jgi:hypothetical protein
MRVRLLQLFNDAESSEKISEEGEDAQIINIFKEEINLSALPTDEYHSYLQYLYKIYNIILKETLQPIDGNILRLAAVLLRQGEIKYR